MESSETGCKNMQRAPDWIVAAGGVVASPIWDADPRSVIERMGAEKPRRNQKTGRKPLRGRRVIFCRSRNGVHLCRVGCDPYVRMDMEFPRYTTSEYWVDAAVHLLGLMFVTIAGPVLVWFVAARGEATTLIAISIYVASLLAMITASASYNMAPIGSLKQWLRRLDHSAIYIKIAGAYTPFAMLSLSGGSGYRLLIGVWIAAGSGVAVKLLWPRRFRVFTLSLYLVMGWAAAPIAGEVIENVQPETWMLVMISGCLYTVGVIFHLWERLPYHNAIWHCFVLVATALMYAAIALEFA